MVKVAAKKKDMDPAQMRTVMRIPWKRAPDDPSWLTKAHAGKKLDAIEVEQWYRHKYNREHEALLKDKLFDGVPGSGKINKVITQYHVYKKNCLLSFLDCGLQYNKKAFEGPYGECGAVDVFGIWKKNVEEKRAKIYVRKLMEHYDFPIYHSPPGLETHLNTFYQAKFGMFSCHDTAAVWGIGKARYDAELVNYWQRSNADKQYTWYLAIAYALGAGKVELDSLSEYRKNYRESTAYRSYLARNSQHQSSLSDMIEHVNNFDYYEKAQAKGMDDKKEERLQLLRRKVQFYLKNEDRGYKVPEEIRGFVSAESEEEREAAIQAFVDAETQSQESQMLSDLDGLRGRQVPDFLLSGHEFSKKSGRRDNLIKGRQ